MSSTERAENGRGFGTAAAAILGALTVFGPISLDLYLPALPALAQSLDVSASAAQLTITTCLLGLAVGQIVAGPFSDRFGRRVPLLIGVAAYIVLSVLCALAPSLALLAVLRFLQGAAGAVGVVIAQAAGRDVYSGVTLIRYYGRLTVLGGLAAIIGPVIGGQLAGITDWRGIFLFLATLGVLILLAVTFFLPETLTPLKRRSGGLPAMTGDMLTLLRDPALLRAVLVMGFINGALFAYLSGATFVLQDIYGLSAQGYSYAFGLNSLGFMFSGWLGGVIAGRWSERGALWIGLAGCTLGSASLLVTALLKLPLLAVVLSLVVMVSGVAFSTPATTSMGLRHHEQLAGTASALLGIARFAFGAAAAPLVGLGGADTAVPLGVVTLIAMVAACTVNIIIRSRTQPVPV